MDKDLTKKLEDSLLYKLYILENINNQNTNISDEEKIEKIERIKKEYENKIAELEKERDVIIQEVALLLEKKRIEEIRNNL